MKNALNPLSIKKYWKNQIPPDINKLHQERKKFIDPYFPPNKMSLISCDQNGYFIDKLKGQEFYNEMEAKIPGIINRIVWKRVTDIYKKWELIENKVELKDIIQGNLGDCYFLTALSSLTRYQYLLIEKFRTRKFNEEGYYEIIFFIDGEWQIVFIDDYFPFDPRQNVFFGARPHNNELWAILLEKAWVKINGGYTNAIGGLFSEAILALTGFPTEIFSHKKLDKNEYLNLYKNIVKGYKEGSIMACGTKNNEPNVERAGLIPGHAYSIVYPHRWKERNIYLIKLRNPWGKNEWRGNWSDNSRNWTEENIKYFQYKKSNDGTLWVDLQEFLYYFDNTYICHLLYGAIVKYFYIENPTYFSKPIIFNAFLEKTALTSISILFKNWRFNREIHEVIHPFSLLLCRYNKYRQIEKIWAKWDSDYELSIIDTLEPGYYCIWMYCPMNQIRGDPNFKFILQISSLSSFSIEFIGQDYDFSFIQYLITSNYKFINSAKVRDAQKYLYANHEDVLHNGLFNSIIYNNMNNPIEVMAIDNGIKNCQLLPPYQGRKQFTIMIPPYESAAILAIRLSYGSGIFNFKYQTSYKTNYMNQNYPNQNINIGDRYSNYLKFKINNDSPANKALRTNEYKFIKREMAKKLPIFNSNNFSLEETIKQSLMIKEEINSETLMKEYPTEFNLLFKYIYKDYTPNIKKRWTKIRNIDGKFVGQINDLTGELEGKGVFFWANGIKYIGFFHKNKLAGKGIYMDQHNKIFYKGHFYNNKKHGYGILSYYNNDYYEGNFYNDNMEGNGTYHFNNGDLWEGTFKKNMKNGIGVFIKYNGEISLVQYENDNYIGGYELSNEEIMMLQNMRSKDRKLFMEQLKLYENDMNSNNFIQKDTSDAANNLFRKKMDLTKTIHVF